MRAKEEMAESYLKLLGKDTETGSSFIDKLFVEVYKEMSDIDGKKELMARIKRGDSLVRISRFYAVSKKEMVNLIRVWFGAEIADKMDRDGRL